MKHKIAFLFALVLALPLTAQVSSRDSVRNAVAARVQAVRQAADQFLNRQQPTESRLKAIEPYGMIHEPDQVEQFKRVAQSVDESPEIRAAALSRIYPYVAEDEKFRDRVIEWFANPDTPRPLRNAALNVVGNLAFSGNIGTLDVYQRMVEDPDLNFRGFAVSKLVLSGDARVQQLLIRGLENPQGALFPVPQSIEFLSLAPKPEYFPAVYRVLLKPVDEASRLAAVQVLGSYAEARPRLAVIAQDAREKEIFRESALRALFAGDRDRIVNYATPVLQDKSASPRLHVLAIQMATGQRSTMAKRRKAGRADAFDTLVRTIAERKGVHTSDEVVRTANEYLLLVKPSF